LASGSAAARDCHALSSASASLRYASEYNSRSVVPAAKRYVSGKKRPSGCSPAWPMAVINSATDLPRKVARICGCSSTARRMSAKVQPSITVRVSSTTRPASSCSMISSGVARAGIS
jgi:hypothetical protein